MAHSTLFEYEDPPALSVGGDARVGPPVLLFRPRPGRIAQLTRTLGDSGAGLAEWVAHRSADPAEPTIGERVVEALTWLVLGLCLVVWSVVGLVFWPAIAVRGILHFSAHLLHAMLAGERPTAAGRRLRDAATFYHRGFVLAVDAVRRTDPRAFVGFQRQEPIETGRLAPALGWVFAVWYAIVLLAGAPVSPPEVWQWITTLPGPELLEAALEGFAGVVRELISAGSRLPGVAALQR